MSRSPERPENRDRDATESVIPEEKRIVRGRRAPGPGFVSRFPGMVYQARVDRTWPMELVSPGALELTGYRPATFLLDGELRFGDIIHEDDADPVWHDVLDAIEEDRPYSVEYRIHHRSGEVRHVWDHGHSVVSREGEILGLEGFILDVTERVGLTERLRDAQRRETIGRLSGVVAHDFNNFLTGILGSLELATAELEPGSPVAEHVSLALESADRARQLTRQLLLVSRGRPQKRQLVDLNARVLEFHGFLRQLVGSPVALTLELEEGPLPLHVDPALVDQMLLNLVVNAREAIDGYGRIEVRVRQLGGEVVLTVRDDGCGMDEETRSRVFDPFFTTKDSGTGLGLATVREIVDELGGRISLESRVGEGTTFDIILPRVPSRPRATTGEEPARPARRGPRGELILVVDDDRTVLEVIRRTLERFGYEVLVATDPSSCRAVIGGLEVPPDLAVMDVTLPEISGIRLARELRDQGLLDRVLFMSGYAAEDVVEGADLLRDSHYLEKPFSVDSLLDAVARALDGAPGNLDSGVA